MKQNLTRIGVFVLIIPGVLTATGRSAQPDTRAADGVQIHFIGNSLTYVNDLPKMVAELARAGGQRPLQYECETPGSGTFEKHWKDGRALAKIQSGKWDYVVLQENSMGPGNELPFQTVRR